MRAKRVRKRKGAVCVIQIPSHPQKRAVMTELEMSLNLTRNNRD